MRYLLATALLLTVAAAPAVAQTQVNAWGVGKESCSQAFAAAARQVKGREHPQAAAGLAADVEDCCRANSTETVEMALRSVMKPLGRR